MLRHYWLLSLISVVLQCAISALSDSAYLESPPTYSIDAPSKPSSTRPQTTPAAFASNATCEGRCYVKASPIRVMVHRWALYQGFSTSITAATLFTIINTVNNTTRTSLRHDELPSGYSRPPQNTNGTRIQTVYYTSGTAQLSTVIAFPTHFIEWPGQYIWSGTLKTLSSCLTASPGWSTVPLTSSPQSISAIMPPFTLGSFSLGFPDPGGLYFYPVSAEFGAIRQFQTSEGAWQSCGQSVMNPLQVLMTARFITHTTVMLEQFTPTPAPAETPSPPGPTSTLPPQRTGSIPAPTISKPRDRESVSNNNNNNNNNNQQHAPTMSTDNRNNNNNNQQHTPAVNQPRPPNIPFITGSGAENIVLSPDRTGVLLPNGVTLFRGSSTALDGITVSLAPSGTAIIVGGSTIPIPTGSAFFALTIGDKTIPISPLTISVSVGPTGFGVLTIGGIEVPITPATAVSGGGIVLPNGPTVLPGSSVVYQGAEISLQPEGKSIVVDGVTVPVSKSVITSGDGSLLPLEKTGSSAMTTLGGYVGVSSYRESSEAIGVLPYWNFLASVIFLVAII